MYTVVSYLRGIPLNNNNPEKPKSLKNFIQGVIAAGDTGVVSEDTRIIRCDTAVIQGYVHNDGKSAPHLTFRQSILNYQKKHNNSRALIMGRLGYQAS